MSRLVRYQVAVSLDGFIAGPNGEYDWIVMDPAIDFAALFKEFDTVIMGRKTYELTTAQGGHGAMPGIEVVVFSRTLRPATYQGVRILNDDPRDVVTALKAKPGRDIWLFGGGELFRSLLDRGPRRHGRSGRHARAPRQRHPAPAAGRDDETEARRPEDASGQRHRGALVLDTRRRGPGAPHSATSSPRRPGRKRKRAATAKEEEEGALSACSALRLDRLRFHGVVLAQGIAAYNLVLDDRTGHCPAG